MSSSAERLRAAFDAEQDASFRQILVARFVALGVMAVWIFVAGEAPHFWWGEFIVVLFALHGVVQGAVRRHGPLRPWMLYAFFTVDLALLTAVALTPSPFDPPGWPMAMEFRESGFIFYAMFLGLTALSFRPGLVLWTGCVGALFWMAGTAFVAYRPGTVAAWNVRSLRPEGGADEAAWAAYLDPNFLPLADRAQEAVVLVILALILAAVVGRSRHLVRRQVSLAGERANLSRYFSPQLVDELAQGESALREVRAQPVAVLFVDIVGFTRMVEGQSPRDTVAFLRAFHNRIEAPIFAHRGTLAKYLGDGVMVTFGTPRPGPQDASDALACARALLDAADAWNAERAAAGEPPVRISIGAHCGECVVGDIGSERQLEYGVVGDVVNVASRLEELTRQLGTQLLVSAELIAAVRAEAADPVDAEHRLAGLEARSGVAVRGRAAGIDAYALVAPATAVAVAG